MSLLKKNRAETGKTAAAASPVHIAPSISYFFGALTWLIVGSGWLILKVSRLWLRIRIDSLWALVGAFGCAAAATAVTGVIAGHRELHSKADTKTRNPRAVKGLILSYVFLGAVLSVLAAIWWITHSRFDVVWGSLLSARVLSSLSP
jgi:hypothetical protein